MSVRNLFLVEDDESLRSLASKVLKGLPHVQVLEFGEAETALGMFAEYPPALLIADLGLPGMSGVEFIARARQMSPRVPVLVTTGNRSRFSSQLTQFSFAEIWEKPFSIQDLRDRAHALLSGAGADEPSKPFMPFSVLDYLQMASFGNHDLVLEAQLADLREGRLEIVDGEIWNCQLGARSGLEALSEILGEPGAGVRFLPLVTRPAERQVTAPTSQVLLELAVAQDESAASTPAFG
jgi:DNA-binding response OmpR family regulator